MRDKFDDAFKRFLMKAKNFTLSAVIYAESLK
jgi:hypothetical protein